MVTFKSLYNTYFDDVFKYALSITKNIDDAKDVTSETFLNAWTSKTEMREETVRQYIFTITKHCALKHIKARNRFDSLQNEHMETQSISNESLTDQLTLLQFYKTISPTDKKISRHVLKGYSYPEISGKLNLSVANIKVRMHRIRKLFKHFIEKENP
jgi:RNA polymerase sigma-70 factor, ECF subfamily